MPAKRPSAIEDAADRIAAKDPDELIDDTREFVRKSPGVALAGAAIIGFALVRLIKSGLDQAQGRRRAEAMANGGDDEVEEQPIGELFGQLIDEGKAYAKAELGLAKATAEAKAEAAKKPALLAAAALLFLIAGVGRPVHDAGLALAPLIGPLPAG